jgi:Fur family ferric uptake transcriptional regulator
MQLRCKREPPPRTSLRALLGGARLRCTAAREAVLAILLATGRPMSREQVASHPGGQRLDRVTIYRTLAALQRAGLVHAVQGVAGPCLFCANAAAEDGCPGGHPHFQCLSCGEMRCLADQGLPRVALAPGTEVRAKQFVVYGTCPSCGRKTRPRAGRRCGKPSKEVRP